MDLGLTSASCLSQFLVWRRGCKRPKRVKIISKNDFQKVVHRYSQCCLFLKQIPLTKSPHITLVNHVFQWDGVSVLPSAQYDCRPSNQPSLENVDDVVPHIFRLNVVDHSLRAYAIKGAGKPPSNIVRTLLPGQSHAPKSIPCMPMRRVLHELSGMQIG